MPTFMILAGLLVVLVLVWYHLKNSNQPKDMVVLLKGAQSGKAQTTVGTPLPRAFNQPEGATYSYAGWVLVNDFTYNQDKYRNVFSRVDMPSLFIDKNSNSFVVSVDTYGAKESVLVPNITAKKWIHFAVVVNQYAVDVYINGILRQHHTLGQLPKQNDANVVIGSTDGFDGTIGGLTYWARSLTQPEIEVMTRKVPDDIYKPPEGPKYFDITWYIGRT
jgi:hypothetical protein